MPAPLSLDEMYEMLMGRDYTLEGIADFDMNISPTCCAPMLLLALNIRCYFLGTSSFDERE